MVRPCVGAVAARCMARDTRTHVSGCLGCRVRAGLSTVAALGRGLHFLGTGSLFSKRVGGKHQAGMVHTVLKGRLQLHGSTSMPACVTHDAARSAT